MKLYFRKLPGVGGAMTVRRTKEHERDPLTGEFTNQERRLLVCHVSNEQQMPVML